MNPEVRKKHVEESGDSAEQMLERAFESEKNISFISDFVHDFPDAELFLVGGAVRDAMIGRANKDFDFVIRNVPPEDLVAWFSERGKVDLVGRNFGVFKFQPKGFPSPEFEALDLALPRTEHSTEDSLGGARDFETQSDSNMSIETDLSRRDFTINAVAFDVRESKLIDYFGGNDDRENKIIKAVGDPKQRFTEDMSRMLRAIRFASQLGFSIEDNTWIALQEKMPDINTERLNDKGKMEYVVPRETIGKEVAKALLANPEIATKLLFESGALRECSPSLHALMEADESYRYPFQTKQPVSIDVAVALLMRGIPEQQVGLELRKLGVLTIQKDSKIRADKKDILFILREWQSNTKSPDKMRAHVFEKTFMNERGKKYLEFLEMVGDTRFSDEAKARIESIKETLGTNIKSFLSGNDVIEHGIKPGPQIRFLLEDLRDAQLEGKITSREEALELLTTLTQ